MPATAAMVAPPVVVLSRESEAIPVIAKVLEVALLKSEEPESVVEAMIAERLALSCPPTLSTLAIVEDAESVSEVPVAERKSKSTKCDVEDAVKPLVSWRSVVVAEVLSPYCVCWVKGHAKVAYVLLSTERVPSLPDVLTKPLEVRLPNFVRYALTALSAVVEANAICDVEDACRPDLNQTAVEVELASVPKLRSEVYGKPMVLVIVTAPVAPETLMPLPATFEVTPELVMASGPPKICRVELSSEMPVPAVTMPVVEATIKPLESVESAAFLVLVR